MRVFYDEDIDDAVLKTKTIAVVGYGNQGRAHALNLRDSGAGRVIVGARAASTTRGQAEADGFEAFSIEEAADRSDIVALLAPDETHERVYADHLAEALPPGATLLFAHGFSVHFEYVRPRADLDVILVAPRGPGRSLRLEYERGRGLPATAAVAQDATGEADAAVMAYAKALGCGRVGVFVSTFEEECVTDLFGEQVVLCGGAIELMKGAFDTLVEAGFSAEMAYFECAYELKRIVDLLEARGFAGMRKAISNTAEFGGYETGGRIVTDDVKAEMRQTLERIRSGQFAEAWMADWDAGAPKLNAARRAEAGHPIIAAEAEVTARARGAATDEG